MQAARHSLPGGRWHFQHGPIDLVIGADGQAEAVAAAHEQAWVVFQPLLAELVSELPWLRQAVDAPGAMLQGPVARCMAVACMPMAAWGFITPMAAVAGAVAQALIAVYQRPGVQRAWVNNGGDIALHLAPDTEVSVGLVADLSRFDAATALRTAAGQGRADGRFVVQHGDPVRGIATSGWRGRSFSLGIADSVTVLAATAAQADAAATVIANAVDCDHPAIRRRPACELRDDSDLGQRLVTVDVPSLPACDVRSALARGQQRARELQRRGLIHAAALVCQGSLAEVLPREPLKSPPETLLVQ